jgi:hypothetical protein
MPNSIFSRYRQGENRVTATLLAVLERLGAETTEALLSTAVDGGDETLQLVRYRNQPMGAGEGVPDAQIRASINLLFETKVAIGSVNKKQLLRHLTALDDGSEIQRLYVLTPDSSEPAAVSELADDRVRWLSFAGIRQAIDEFIGTEGLVISERDQFLLRQLQGFLDEEGLVRTPDQVLIVPARVAFDEYLTHSAYVCQPGRTFRNVEYLGFYRKRQIEAVIPKVLYVRDQVVFSKETATELETQTRPFDHDIAQLIRSLLQTGARTDGAPYKVMLLSPQDAPATLKLTAPIAHTGRNAWVQGQRYARRAELEAAKTTDDLVTSK